MHPLTFSTRDFCTNSHKPTVFDRTLLQGDFMVVKTKKKKLTSTKIPWSLMGGNNGLKACKTHMKNFLRLFRALTTPVCISEYRKRVAEYIQLFQNVFTLKFFIHGMSCGASIA